MGLHEYSWKKDRGHAPLRILRQANGGASDAVPLLPRGGSAGAIVATYGTGRAAPDSPRPSLYASRGRDPQFPYRLRRSLSDSSASPRPATRDAVPHAADFPRRPWIDSLRLLSPNSILIHGRRIGVGDRASQTFQIPEKKYCANKGTCSNGQRD